MLGFITARTNLVHDNDDEPNTELIYLCLEWGTSTCSQRRSVNYSFYPLHRSVDTVVIKMRIVDAKKPQRRSMGRIGGLELYDRRTFDFSSSIRVYGYTKLS